MKNIDSVSMMGVLIYISADRGRAIIWCDDQGPLAYVRGDKLLLDGDSGVSVGDCVRFDARTDGDFRIARGLTTIAMPKMAKLPDVLRGQAAVARKPAVNGNVVYPEFTKQRRYG